MKKIIIATIFGFLVVNISAQTTFFRWFPYSQNKSINNVIEVNNKSYLLSGSRFEETVSLNSAYLLKIDSSGSFISENINFVENANSSNTILFSLPSDSNSINVLNSQKFVSDSTSFNVLSFEKYSMCDFELMNNRSYTTPMNKLFLPQSVIVVDSSIFVQSIIVNHLIAPIGFMVSKYNFNFDSITTYMSYENLVTAFGIINDSISLKIKNFTLTNRVELKCLNYDLSLNDSSNISFGLFANASVALNKNNYILTGMTTSLNWPKEHIKVGLFNMNNELVDSVSYRNHPDSVLYCSSVTNTAVVGNQIFVVGNYHFNPSQFPWQSHPTCIQITIMDTSLNIIGHHFYGGDAVYMPHKIISTSDGGALIVGNRYDHTNPSVRLYHPFALKINNQGLVVAEIEDQDYPVSYSAIVFPNPGKEFLHLTSGIQLNNGIFTLYDIRGRPVLTKEIIATEMQFDTSNLASGMYVWRIVRNNKVMDSGKWVKE